MNIADEASEGSMHGPNLEPDLEEDSFRLRPYQAEMVEESLRSNIICVMDTGSGKTHIAIERARIELETCQPEKKVWFLAPTVTLLDQQHQVFKKHLPSYGCQMLCGNDNVDHWTEQSTWDSILHNIRIVLSTYQVLLDALTHAFVTMDQLVLLIFDEAHHCTRKHPAHRIMSDFYMPRLDHGHDQLPKILGLSASPVMKARATSKDLQQIEQNLYATAKTPKIHRTELMRYVYVPTLIERTFRNNSLNLRRSKLANELRQAFDTYDLREDPYVLSLLKSRRVGYDISMQLNKVFVSGKTYCRTQLKSFVTKAEAMLEELGSSAMDWYVQQCIARFETMVGTSAAQLLDGSDDEKQYLLSTLQRLPSRNCGVESSISFSCISPKVELLMEVLIEIANETPHFIGLVFVEQRVWVAALAELLSTHPRTKDIFRLGTFVGSSQSSRRKTDVATLAEPRNQQTTLDDFRGGKINLILATSVLEEGIDISNCHIVICFERPKNLKSFVQRRGRARMQESKYIIFTPEEGRARHPQSWQALEEEMRAAYLDDLRKVETAYEEEHEDEEGRRFFRVPNTGALLTLENASQHLHHFCALLSSGPYNDTRPQFDFTKTTFGLITACVVLPISVDPAIRTATSTESWRTERMARKDAAFEAYRALYAAGLVNDHLLPARQELEDDLADIKIRNHQPSLVSASATFDPWPEMARCQAQNANVYHRTLLKVQQYEAEPMYMLVFTPTSIPTIPQVTLYWNESKHIAVDVTPMTQMLLRESDLDTLKIFTLRALHSVYHSRMQSERSDFLSLIAPCDATGSVKFAETAALLSGTKDVKDVVRQGKPNISTWGLVCERGDTRKYLVNAINCESTDHFQISLEVKIQAVSLPKRRDFLHPVSATVNKKDAYTKVVDLDGSNCVVEEMPAIYSSFALLFPSILYRFEVGIVAETLMDTLLRPVALSKTHLPLIITAITSSQTGEHDNYQRLEFLGDCLLKFITTVHLLAVKPLWPVGLLTARKECLVSNAVLSRATLATGLDRFIINKRFTGANWAPHYADDILSTTDCPQKVQRSSKLLADVVESLVGASYVAGGFDKAILCVQTLLPFENWTPVSHANMMMYAAFPNDYTHINFGLLENLIDYSFNNKILLLEALTHGSYTGPHARCSYERLEYLGDAVLEYLVSKRLYTHEPSLLEQEMHGIRTAMVNASFLAFSMFEMTMEEETTNKTNMQPEIQQRALWQYLRSSSLEVSSNRDAAFKQHLQTRDEITVALKRNTKFPWHLLALTDAPKFLSDIVESVLGAIYIDSHGDVATCETFIGRLGILDCLQRILRDAVDCLHPKERLGHLASERQVQYLRITSEDQVTGSGNEVYRCQVRVGEVNVGGVVEGLKRLNAETLAAWKACALLEEEDKMSRENTGEDDAFFDADEGGGILLGDC